MKRSILLLVLAACGSPGAPPAASAASPTARPGPRDRLAPCQLDGVTGPVLCGSYAVWENRATRQGRKIDLRVIVLPALGADVAPDPLVDFAGGPGASATDAVRGWAQRREIRAHRDILLVDQRGTGGSHRLDCKVPRDPADVQGFFEPVLPPADVHRCRGELEQNADLAQYTTSIAADDLDEVRAWLGYDQLDLHGGSYGTRAAQVYLRRHGDHVRSAVLIGVVAMDQYLPLFHARDGQRALDRLFDTCAHTPACAAAFPDLPAELERVLAGLDRERGHASVESPVDHHRVAVTIPRDIFAEQIRFSLYGAGIASVTPYVLHRAAQGDFEPFAQMTMALEPSLRRALAYGMHLSVTCAEDLPFIAPASIEPAIAGTYLRGYRVQMQLAACHDWPRGDIPSGFHEPVRSDRPVLMLSGPFDPVTPPPFADKVAATLPHALQVIIPEAHHGSGGLTHQDCDTGLIAQFVERGSADGLDTSCVAAMARPPFVTDAAGFAALLQSGDD
ncbi:MAG TPA: alpha/beta fold hydrolase [Kofleriaceae bacterium]|jgi:pimeloyl-ACP methyl ester carboxylesterase|nr:alpha/beta fold hydrolase [Kofleriaceae bacterium]